MTFCKYLIEATSKVFAFCKSHKPVPQNENFDKDCGMYSPTEY